MTSPSVPAIVAPGGPRGGGADASFSPNPRSANTFTCSRRRGQLSRDYIEPFASAAAANRVEALSESVQQDLAKVTEECRSDMKKVFREVLRVQTTVDAAVNFYTQYLFQREPAVRSFFGYNDDTDLQQLAFKSYDFSSFVTSVMSHIRGLTESLDDPAVFELFVKKIGRVHALVTCLSKPWMYYYGECLLEFVKHIMLDPNAPASDEESNNFKRTENAFRQIWYLIVEHAWRWTELERDALAKQDEERERKQQQQQQQQNRSPSPQQQTNANNNIPITVTPSATLLKPTSSNTAMPRESTM